MFGVFVEVTCVFGPSFDDADDLTEPLLPAFLLADCGAGDADMILSMGSCLFLGSLWKTICLALF